MDPLLYIAATSGRRDTLLWKYEVTGDIVRIKSLVEGE